MTTIAYRDGVMAADSRAWSGEAHPLGEKTKIRRLDDGRLIGASSNGPGVTEAVLDWYTAGADGDNPPKDIGGEFVNMIVVHPDGTAQFAIDRFYLTGRVIAPFFAIGSGKKYAWGALAMGADAVRAIEVACLGDHCSAGPITVLRHGE